jgi:hypothetical protein
MAGLDSAERNDRPTALPAALRARMNTGWPHASSEAMENFREQSAKTLCSTRSRFVCEATNYSKRWMLGRTLVSGSIRLYYFFLRAAMIRGACVG